MKPIAIGNMLVGDVLAKWPQTAPVFNRHKMACPGCAMAPFMTLNEACASYGVDIDGFVAELEHDVVVSVEASI